MIMKQAMHLSTLTCAKGGGNSLVFHGGDRQCII